MEKIVEILYYIHMMWAFLFWCYELVQTEPRLIM